MLLGPTWCYTTFIFSAINFSFLVQMCFTRVLSKISFIIISSHVLTMCTLLLAFIISSKTWEQLEKMLYFHIISWILPISIEFGKRSMKWALMKDKIPGFFWPLWWSQNMYKFWPILGFQHCSMVKSKWSGWWDIC